MKKKLWIITELFLPEETSTAYIFGEIANSLIDKYDVNVICGPEIYDKNKKINRNSSLVADSSINVYRVKGVNENKNSVLSRANKFLTISYRLYKLSKKLIKRDDIVLLATNPFPLIIPIAKLKRKRGFDLKLLVHDIFPEPLKIHMKIPNVIYQRLHGLFSRAYSSCDLLISLGEDMTDLLRKKTYKYKKEQNIVQIENWGDTINIYPKEHSSNLPDNKVVIQYAGNIGEAQGVQQFVSILATVNNPNLLLSIWGTGKAEPKLKKYVEENALNDIVSFNGSYLRSEQCDVLNQCDLALVSLRNSILGLGVPSKSYNILAAGKPILFIGPLQSEIAIMINKNNIGFCFDENDIEGITHFLSSLKKEDIIKFEEMGKRARLLAENKYSKQAILTKIKENI